MGNAAKTAKPPQGAPPAVPPAAAPKAPAKAAAKKPPVEVVDLEEQTSKQVEKPDEGVKFCFNEITVHKFKDGTSYHVQKQRATITDPKLIENLKEAAKNPHNRIFIEG